LIASASRFCSSGVSPLSGLERAVIRFFAAGAFGGVLRSMESWAGIRAYADGTSKLLAAAGETHMIKAIDAATIPMRGLALKLAQVTPVLAQAMVIRQKNADR
jgi:hypothetical protein